LITHAVRTLDARPAAGLGAEEQLQNEKMLQLVLNAKRPLPEANPDKKVRHYIFRVKTELLLAGVGALARTALLLRARVANFYLGMTVLSALVVGGILRMVRGDLDLAVAGGAVAALALGAAWALRLARRDLVARGDV